MGESWPPAPDLHQAHRRTRRVRRWASAAILLAGIIDLLDAITPPLRGRLHLVLEFLPLRASEAAGALIAIAGLALLALGRGILRGQRRAWRVAVVLLSGTIVLHLVAGADFEESLVAGAVLVLLLTNRRDFQAASDQSSLRSALIALGVAGSASPWLTTASIELFTHIDRDSQSHIPWWTAWWAVSERLVGIQTVPLPHRADRFLAPTLLAIGLTLVAITLFLLTRPVVDRRLTSGRAAEFRARDIVRRHGISTLDYFALRSDKQWFFHRDSLVAYAVYGGVCLISPDPIGPRNEREQVWAAFRQVRRQPRLGDLGDGRRRGLALHLPRLGHAQHLPRRRGPGDRCSHSACPGGGMKGLRQAHNRIAKYGYTATFHDPAHLDPGSVQGAHGVDEHEPAGRARAWLLDDARPGIRPAGHRPPAHRGPRAGRSPAAMCQFVPAPGINGYSLDLMRRDPGEHPNGLLDFALCSTIEHLRAERLQGPEPQFRHPAIDALG